MLKQLQLMNKQLNIVSVYDETFLQYGSLLSSSLFLDAFDYLEKHTSVPTTGNNYIAHDKAFYNSVSSIKPYQEIFGNIDLEFGYVNGMNSHLNALEYHKTPEINICVSPLVLLLGKRKDFIKGYFDVKKLKAFYIPEKTVIQINPYTFHFSPCKVKNAGFRCGVILPYGTNMELETKEPEKEFEDRLLFKCNKWLIAHPDNHKLIKQGAYCGIIGENIEIKY